MDKSTMLSSFEREVNGERRQFFVQILPDNRKEEAIDIFSKYFVRDEPLCRSSNLIDDEECMKFLVQFWWKVINEDTTLACFVELGGGKKQLVAVNLCHHASVNEEIVDYIEAMPEKIKPLLHTIEYVTQLKNISQEIGVTEYLGAYGLVTIPDYRGLNIGLEVLNARKPLCQKLGLTASVTAFTSPASQRLADKAGFKDLVSITYDDLENILPSLKFTNINEYSKRIRSMYILYK